jgi:HlyD family secretion protein
MWRVRKASGACRRSYGPARRRILPAVAFLVALSVSWGDANVGDGRNPAYRYVRIARGDIVQSVTAAGTLEAVDTVEVSSQLSGQIARVMVGHNAVVRAGEALAALDSASFEAEVEEAKAALAVAEAEHEDAKAAIQGTEVRLEEAMRDLKAKEALLKGGNVSPREVDRSRAAAQGLSADLASAQAREKVKAAAIAAARAALSRANIDLKRTVIRSPIDGVVIRRSVEMGQTVAASFQAPTLFTIARDLADMRVNASVSEADIGVVRTGQSVAFEVDSYPGRRFEGRVLEIRKAPRTIQNVVAYTVMTSASNRDDLLLPGMTANVRIVIRERLGVTVVPNAALNFRPVAAFAGGMAPGQGALWVASPSGALREVPVSLGASSEAMSEVVSGLVAVGDDVAVGYGERR